MDKEDTRRGINSSADEADELLRRKEIHFSDARRELHGRKALTYKQQTVSMIGCCLCSFICLGFSFSLSTLYVDIIDVYQAPRSQASLVQSLCIGIMFGSGIVAGAILERLGIRRTISGASLLSAVGLVVSWFAGRLVHLIICVGVTVGFGNGLLNISCQVAVAKIFTEKRRRLILPAIQFAGGVGTLAFPKVLEFLTSQYGLRGCLLIIASLYLNLVVVALAITSPLVMGSSDVDPQRLIIPLIKKFRFLKNPLFMVFILTEACAFGTQNGLTVAMLDFLQSRGIHQTEGIQWFLVFAAISTSLKLVFGFLMLVSRVRGVTVFCCSLLLSSSSMIIISNFQNGVLVRVLIISFALGYGGISGTAPATIVEIVGLEAFPFALGISDFLNGISIPSFSAVAGAVYDHLRSYDLQFTIFGTIGVAAACLPLLVVASQRLINGLRTV